MLARIAQELFWLGRDLVRAEQTARMLDGAFHADVVGAGSRGVALSWEGVLAVIGAKPPAPGEETGEEPAADPSERDTERGRADVTAGAVVLAGGTGPLGRAEIAPLLTLETSSPASVVSCVYRGRERARTLRDVISTEMWEALNGFYLSLGRYDLQAALATGPYSVYQEVKERCGLFWGLAERTMLADEGRAFLQAGGRIEAADMVLRMLRVSVPQGMSRAHAVEDDPDSHQGEALALLQAVGGFQAYRRAVRQAPELRRVVRFLLYERTYPGSVASSLDELREALERADVAPRSSPPVLRLGRLMADLELQRRMPEQISSLDDLLAQVQEELALIDRAIDERYFAVAALVAVHV
ncbi:MAG TPA: alpha-E domain-containing protein [Solirubrobacteraceae bacterium]|nr:alpha-E domain-containing protein [Solirubrobacteraceae bacterium]